MLSGLPNRRQCSTVFGKRKRGNAQFPFFTEKKGKKLRNQPLRVILFMWSVKKNQLLLEEQDIKMNIQQ